MELPYVTLWLADEVVVSRARANQLILWPDVYQGMRVETIKMNLNLVRAALPTLITSRMLLTITSLTGGLLDFYKKLQVSGV